MADFTKAEMAFINAVKAMEKRAHKLHAFVVVNPSQPDNRCRYVVSYSDSNMTCKVIAWLPGRTPSEAQRHHGSAGGGGYDRATAAMGGASFWNLKTGQMDKLKDEGHDTRAQLEAAGYIVIQAC